MLKTQQMSTEYGLLQVDRQVLMKLLYGLLGPLQGRLWIEMRHRKHKRELCSPTEPGQ